MTRRWVGPVIIAAMFVFAFVMLPGLPDRVPSHWDIHGRVNDTLPRMTGAFLFGGIALVLWLAMSSLPRIDPFQKQRAVNKDTYILVLNMLLVALAVMEVLALGSARGWPIDMGRAPFALVGVMFLGVGNYLPRLRPNWWMGVRTPWTLSSEHVWRETHRVSGAVMVVGGVILTIAAMLGSPMRFWIAGCALAIIVIVPILYSYLSWRRLQDHPVQPS